MKVIEKYKTGIIIAFFSIFFTLGLNIYKDYGVSTDEQFSRMNGLVSFSYIAKGILPGFYKKHLQNVDHLHEYKDKDYGVFFELPAVVLEIGLGLHDYREVFLMRHLLNFLVFFLGVVFFYMICLKRFKDWKIALFGSFFLIVSPRIFGQAFYNSKDVVFMAMIIISIYTMIQFLDTKTIRSALWHSFACAAAIDVRIMGVIIPGLTFGLIFLDIIKQKNTKAELKKQLSSIVLYFLVLNIFTILFWPYLWENPLNNFVQAFKNMSKFRWYGTYPFMGKQVFSTKLPWYYVPVWIIISTPIPYVLLFISGCIFILKKIKSRGVCLYQNNSERIDIISLTLFFAPLIAIILMKSVLYDAWRQVYFIYPAFLLTSIAGFTQITKLITKKTSKMIFVSITVISILPTMFFMLRNHPYQDVYFSFLGKESIENGFERDYYGLSYRKGLEYILEHDKSSKVNIKCSNTLSEYLISLNSMLLSPDDRKRINVTCAPKAAKWIITNYRWDKGPFVTDKEVYNINVDDVKILSIFKMQ